jgi:hypothetical protein
MKIFLSPLTSPPLPELEDDEDDDRGRRRAFNRNGEK